MKLTVYTKTHCPFCDRVKELLDRRGVQYTAVCVDNNADALEFLQDQGLRSVPQVFDGTTLLPGGFQGLAAQPELFWTQINLPNLGSL